jgi:hypothetical protein
MRQANRGIMHHAESVVKTARWQAGKTITRVQLRAAHHASLNDDIGIVRDFGPACELGFQENCKFL